jgi:chromosome segregation ATPase
MAATNAQVTSIDALGDFRSDLIVFRATAMRALDEASAEVSRTRQWIRHDQRLHWEGEIRRRQKKLDQAQQELMAARLSSLQDNTSAQQNAVNKARAALHEAEEKLRAVRYWDQNFDLAADPLVKQLGALRTVLEQDMPKAIAFLANAQRALDVYSEKHDTTGPQTEPAPAPEEQENP